MSTQKEREPIVDEPSVFNDAKAQVNSEDDQAISSIGFKLSEGNGSSLPFLKQCLIALAAGLLSGIGLAMLLMNGLLI